MKIDAIWGNVLASEMKKEYFISLEKRIEEEYRNCTVLPDKEDIFKAFSLTQYDNVKVVILGQDPYPSIGVANGLAFSTNQKKLPHSLKNIYQELKSDLDIERINGDLSSWARQGVLLLNTCLTVRANQPNSHSHIGWEKFTDAVISLLNDYPKPLIFVLWGNNAITKTKIITNPIHKIISSSHPSPLSAYRGFLGSKPFSKINQYLIDNHETIIDWS